MLLRTNVFHNSLLEQAPSTVRLAEDEEAEDEEKWDVEEILDFRVRDGQLEYLIKWMDFGPESNSREPVGIFNCPEKTVEFHRRHRERPGVE